ncbi:hypothetical protein DPMN_142673 [Dreissena polymorpha]|uniref:Uncharacterized protein n=1 Tax=Dreissena polymorpha TaxID=45954 RepID=A0A9D4GBQ0_DREPO|nr:hypothetical protein DPMN_142673 [Dreissena polymorpha]
MCTTFSFNNSCTYDKYDNSKTWSFSSDCLDLALVCPDAPSCTESRVVEQSSGTLVFNGLNYAFCVRVKHPSLAAVQKDGD